MVPKTMRAIAMDGYGGPEVLKLHDLPVPSIGGDAVLIKVAVAGVGVWDAEERAGLLAAISPDSVKAFPRILGADGSGTVAAVGANVADFGEGVAVYAYGFLNPLGGFYAEYASVPATQVARLPAGLDMEQAGALAASGITALRGLEDTLKLQPSQKILVFGASGGVGLPAVQLAKAMGAQVIAVVLNADGAALAKEAGADRIANSKSDDLAAAIAAFAPGGLDAVLACASANGLDTAIAAVRDGGRVAYPDGVQPEPQGRPGVAATAYEGTPGREVMDRLNAWIESRRFVVQISGRFALAEAARAHQAMQDRHVGRIILTVA